MTAPPNFRLVHRIAGVVDADPCGGVDRRDLAARLHVRPSDPVFNQALMIAAHRGQIALCLGYVAAPVATGNHAAKDSRKDSAA